MQNTKNFFSVGTMIFFMLVGSQSLAQVEFRGELQVDQSSDESGDLKPFENQKAAHRGVDSERKVWLSASCAHANENEKRVQLNLPAIVAPFPYKDYFGVEIPIFHARKKYLSSAGSDSSTEASGHFAKKIPICVASGETTAQAYQNLSEKVNGQSFSSACDECSLDHVYELKDHQWVALSAEEAQAANELESVQNKKTSPASVTQAGKADADDHGEAQYWDCR